MSQLQTKLQSLREAASELIGQVREKEVRIAELRKQRDNITTAPLSKADYLEYLAAYFKRQGARFGVMITDQIGKSHRNFSAMELLGERSGVLQCQFLTGYYSPQVLTEEAVYFYFGDLMVERIGVALDKLEWPKEAVPASERRALVDKLDKEIVEIVVERDGLVLELEEAGITSY